jgi:hypothetical protein
MLRNDDRIAQPARGRFFPVSVAETARLIRELGFATPTYRKRLDITLRNGTPSGTRGWSGPVGRRLLSTMRGRRRR